MEELLILRATQRGILRKVPVQRFVLPATQIADVNFKRKRRGEDVRLTAENDGHTVQVYIAPTRNDILCDRIVTKEVV